MKKFNVNRVRKNLCYSVFDICRLLEVHKNTVREWIRKGLPTLDQQRPLMIHGQDLKTILNQRPQSQKRKCKANEFYCLKCKCPRTSMGNLVDVEKRNEKMMMLKGLCSVCETSVFKLQAQKNIQKVAAVFDLSQQQLEHIKGCLSPSSNCAFERKVKT